MTLVLIIFAIVATALFYWRFRQRSKDVLSKENLKSVPQFQNSKLVSVILGLEEDSLEELFGLYKSEFGKGAARYARKTHQKWKNGKVRPNEQTYQRLLVHLPKVMDFDLKTEVLRHLMEEYCVKDEHQLTIYTDDWEEKLTPLIEQIIEKNYRAGLPKQIEEKLQWLSEGEMPLAQEILRKSQAEEAKIAVSMLRQEIENLEKMLAETNLNPKITHRLKFPGGTIILNIKKK